jgi:hypothetical protein
LKDNGLLSRHKVSQQHNRAIREFQRIMMLGVIIEPYLAKPREPRSDVSPKQEAYRLDVSFKGEFGPRTKADRDRWVVGTGKAARGGGSEFGRDQCLGDFGGTTCHRMQTVIAHRALLQKSYWRSMKPSWTHLVAILGEKPPIFVRREG